MASVAFNLFRGSIFVAITLTLIIVSLFLHHFLPKEHAIPIISFRNINESLEARNKISSQIDDALKTVGFFVLKDHPINVKTLEETQKITLEYFAFPVEEKKKIPMSPDYPYGFSKSETLSLSETDEIQLPDLKETFQVMLGDENDNNIDPIPLWPNKPIDFKSLWTNYYRKCEILSKEILSLMALALNLESNYFNNFLTSHSSVLRGAFYPQIVNMSEVSENQFRCSQHSDWGALTLVLQDHEGLEVKTRSGNWISVPFLKNSFVVNIGDLMARWTNDVYVSTKHRVVVEPKQSFESRLSLVFFLLLGKEHMVHCVHPEDCKYEPINAFDYNMMKHQQAKSKSNED